MAREVVTDHMQLPDEPSREAVRTRLGVSMLVEAGAGSGKTTLIVDRLLALVRSGVPVDSIAAVTFTRKAANELRERFETQLERDATMSEQSRGALRERERMFVGTIHSFCSRVLREHAIEAGIPPNFEELDDVAESVLREKFWRAFIAGELLAGSTLVSDLERVALSPRELLASFDAFNRHRDAIFDIPIVDAPPHDKVVAALMALEARCAPLRERAAGARCAIFDTMTSLMRAYRASGGWTNGADVARAVRRLPREEIASFIPVTLFGRKNIDKEPMKQLLELYERFLEEVLVPWEQAWAAHAYAPVMRLMRAASDRFTSERRLHGQLTFDDLLFETARLLRESPSLRHIVSARWAHLLVDEFQDTDPVQAEIALLITASSDDSNWRNVHPKPGSLFIVGDPKQSIYRFRRADIATYEFVKSRIASCGEIHQLTSNFRSASAIADLVNAHFVQAFPETVASNDVEVLQAAFAPMIPAGAVTQGTAGTVSRYLAGASARQRPAETCADDAQLLASWVKQRIESGERSAADFLVLTSQRTRLHQYAREFGRHSIPVEVNGANHETDALLQELVVVLRALADPSNPVRVIAALEGLSCGANHAELFAYRTGWDIPQWDITIPPHADGPVAAGLAQLHEWWLSTQTLPAASVIERVVDDLALIPLLAGSDLGESRSGLLLHLISRIREQHGEASTLDGALVLLDELLSSENTAPPLRPHRAGALRLMNLHKAKGLEANVVVLAAPVKDGEHPRRVIAWRASDGTTHAALNVFDDTCTLAAPLNWVDLAAADELRTSAERDRLLYVATTRAREELVVAQRRPYESSGESRGDESAWAPLAPLLAASEPLPLVRRERVMRNDVGEIDLAMKLDALTARRASATEPAFNLMTVTDAAKRISADADDVDQPLSINNTPVDEGARLGMEMGSALHMVLNGALRGRRGDVLEQFIDAIAWNSWSQHSHGVLESNRDILRSLVSNAMQSDGWKSLQEGDILAELPVAAFLADGEPVLLEGVLDAIAINDGKAIIVDWKSAASDERFAGLRAGYETQGAAYADIVTRRTGFDTRFTVQPVRRE